MEKMIHQGRNVKRFREMMGIKQEGLAYELGEDWNQQKVSLLEQKEVIEDGLLAQIASLLKVPAEAIRNFDEENVINIIGNSVTEVHDNATGQIFQFHPSFNPLDKLMEAHQENKSLYERLLQSEKEKVALLQQLLQSKS